MSQETKKNKEVRMPHTYVIIFWVIIACWLLTFLVPVGKFNTQKITYNDAEGKEKSRTVLKTDTFRYEYELDKAKLKTNLEQLIK